MKMVDLTANKRWIEGIPGSPTPSVSQSWRSEPRHKILGCDYKHRLPLCFHHVAPKIKTTQPYLCGSMRMVRCPL